jgi:hypothetical protein
MTPAPKAFMSYSWDGDAHRSWVQGLATKLRADGIDVTLDQWHAVPGDQLTAFMEGAIRNSDFVLIVCTPHYQRKSDSRAGGVGYEGDVMTGEVFTQNNHRKFLPILRSGGWNDASPSWLRGKYYIDLRNDPYPEAAYKDLLSTLHNARPEPPPIGPRPAFSSSAEKPSSSRSGSIAELAIVLDLAVDFAKGLENVGYTFGEARRILAIIERLYRLIPGALERSRDSLTQDVAYMIDKLVDDLEHFISEAYYVLPHLHEDKWTRDREYLKRDKLNIIQGWESLKSRLLSQRKNLIEFEELKSANVFIWKQLGFDSRDKFWRFISPHTQEMIDAAGDIERDLIGEIVEKGVAQETALVTEGYPKEIVVEVVNALIRDKYLQTEDFKTFSLTPLGKRIVSRLLQRKE